jgi:DNA repair exonuclease SbcCD nuclease subunit
VCGVVNGMRIVIASDFHGDWFTDGYERLDDLEEAAHAVLVEACKADVFMFLGDLTNPYSKNVHHAVRVAVGMASQLNTRNVVNYWLTGNHDVIEDGDRVSHTLLALKNLHHGLTKVIDEPLSIMLTHGKRLIALPFVAPSIAYDPAAFIHSCHKITEEFDERVLIAGHLNIEGIEPGSETTDMARGRDIFFPLEAVEECYPKALLFNGHYHERQVFKRINIPGSLLRLTHGEETNNPGFLVVEL